MCTHINIVAENESFIQFLLLNPPKLALFISASSAIFGLKKGRD